MSLRIVKCKEGEDLDDIARREFGDEAFIPCNRLDRPDALTIGYIEDPSGNVYAICRQKEED